MEQGSTATSFEQYGASPSPEFPSEIQSVGDDINLFSGLVKGKGLNSTTGAEITSSSNAVSDYISVDFNKNPYYISGLINTLGSFFAGYNQNKEFVSRTNGKIQSESLLSKDLFVNGTAQGTGDIKYLRITQYEMTNTTGTINEIDGAKIKLQKGTVATAYSEYGKGTVEIKQTGKNLWDEQWELGLYSNADGSKAESSTNIRSKNYIPCLPNTEYYLKVNAGNRICFYDKDKSFISIVYDKQNTVFTTPLNCYYMTFNLGSAYGTTYNNDTMIIKGSITTEYEAYKENNYVIPLSQPLRSLPNGVCDTIEEDGIHRRVGSATVNIHTITTLSNGNIGGIANLTNKIANYEENVICSKAVAIRSFEENTVYINISNSVFVGNPTDTLETIKEKFDGAEIIYELAEEVIEPFDEEQQAVIDEIYNTGTVKGVTNISSSSLIEPEFDIEYYKDLEILFNNLSQAIIGGN